MPTRSNSQFDWLRARRFLAPYHSKITQSISLKNWCLWLFLAYDVGVNLLSASGNERKILTADGGSIRIKQVGFVNQGDNLSICIENDDSLLHVYQGPGQNFPSTYGSVHSSVHGAVHGTVHAV